MSEKEQKRSAAYEKAWAAFQELDIEERAAFLVEATAATLGHGLERAGRSLANVLEDLFNAAETSCDDGAQAETEPKPKSTARKPTRKRATRKSPPKAAEDDNPS